MPVPQLNSDEVRHLLRRLAFAATPEIEPPLRGLSAEAALDRLWTANQAVAAAAVPAFLSYPWVNTALAYAQQQQRDFDRKRTEQLALHEQQTRQLRAAWVQQMALGAAPLRENLTLFLHGLFGSSSTVVEIPQALRDRNALLWRASMGSIPDLLEQLVLDPAMMMQIGMDGHSHDRVSDRPAQLILDHWTVGSGAYADSDVEALSRALTGWSLGLAPDAAGSSPALNASAPTFARRTGLTPRFSPSAFDSDAKPLLGKSTNFDARSAMRYLALQPATARRFSSKLIRYLGVQDPRQLLENRLADIYLSTEGSMRALLTGIVTSPEFWSEASQWSLIKSPVHLVVGACRQLQLPVVPAGEIDRWLIACGQTLFNTPSNGEGGWPDQEAWLSPPDRLATRYQLPAVLSGKSVDFGMAASKEPAGATPQRSALPASVTADEWLQRLDPSPGVEARVLHRRLIPGRDTAWEIVTRVMATPQYQMA